MKIFNVKKIRELDAFSIKEEKIQSVELMERAAKAFCAAFEKLYGQDRPIMVFCGLGNNGGDGLAITRLLLGKKYKIKAYVLEYSKQSSEDFSINENSLSEIDIKYIREDGKLPDISRKSILIDAIFGSGLTRPVDGFVGNVIEHINRSEAEVVAVDLPSGLYADKPSTEGAKIKAKRTLSFQLPKLAFMMPENGAYVGEWELLDIGLSKKHIKKTEAGAHYLTEKDIRKRFKKRPKFAHKGNFGHALLLAGSFGKMGAALLSAKACLRGGAGLLTAHVPEAGYGIMQTAIPEAMCSVDPERTELSKLPENMGAFNAIGIGPGIGVSKNTANLVLQVFKQHPDKKVVIDADAINILARYRQLLSLLPKNAVLTPHPKEFERLIGGKPANDFDRLRMQAAFCAKYGVYIVYKGAHTTIGTPEGRLHFNSTGNPGMATAGSGDCLTGLILSLLAQGIDPKQAAIIGVFTHGQAGDEAKRIYGERSMIAGDINDALPAVFKNLEKNN